MRPTEAMLRAAKRLQAKIDRGPDFGDYPRTQDEQLNNEIAQDQYAQGFSVGVLATTYIDGIPVERGSGIYDTLFGRGNLLLDEEVERYREFRKQDPSLAGLEIIAIRDRSTAAELARRSGQVDLPTFNQSRKTLEKMSQNQRDPRAAFPRLPLQALTKDRSQLASDQQRCRGRASDRQGHDRRCRVCILSGRHCIARRGVG